jgi:hypothetical protein
MWVSWIIGITSNDAEPVGSCLMFTAMGFFERGSHDTSNSTSSVKMKEIEVIVISVYLIP